uniref:Wd repeat-containing protein 44 n=1 Tax=Anisakis simplex TaxID=6269 RepID=A0A0M3KI50_ANISI
LPPPDLNEEPPPPREPIPTSRSEKELKSPTTSRAPSEACPLLTDPPSPPTTNNRSRTTSVVSEDSAKSRSASISTCKTSPELILRNAVLMSQRSLRSSQMLETQSIETVIEQREVVAISMPDDENSQSDILNFDEPEEDSEDDQVDGQLDDEEMETDGELSDRASTATSPTPDDIKGWYGLIRTVW